MNYGPRRLDILAHLVKRMETRILTQICMKCAQKLYKNVREKIHFSYTLQRNFILTQFSYILKTVGSDTNLYPFYTIFILF